MADFHWKRSRWTGCRRSHGRMTPNMTKCLNGHISENVWLRTSTQNNLNHFIWNSNELGQYFSGRWTIGTENYIHLSWSRYSRFIVTELWHWFEVIFLNPWFDIFCQNVTHVICVQVMQSVSDISSWVNKWMFPNQLFDFVENVPFFVVTLDFLFLWTS